jgi:hypothetical protein
MAKLGLEAELPSAWKVMYGVMTGMDGRLTCSGDGAGGGICLAAAGSARLVGTVLEGNSGAMGGAISASSSSSPSCESFKEELPSAAAAGQEKGDEQATTTTSSSSSSCNSSSSIDMVNVTSVSNSARQAGGALYTSTPKAVNMAVRHEPAAAGTAAAAAAHQERLLQQLAVQNSVGPGGYGPGAASYPVRVTLEQQQTTGSSSSIGSSSSGGSSSNDEQQQRPFGAFLDQQQQQQQQQQHGQQGFQEPRPAGRKLLDLNSIMADLRSTFTDGNTQNKVFSAVNAAAGEADH